jgi:hypothetical protein
MKVSLRIAKSSRGRPEFRISNNRSAAEKGRATSVLYRTPNLHKGFDLMEASSSPQASVGIRLSEIFSKGLTENTRAKD